MGKKNNLLKFLAINNIPVRLALGWLIVEAERLEREKPSMDGKEKAVLPKHETR